MQGWAYPFAAALHIHPADRAQTHPQHDLAVRVGLGVQEQVDHPSPARPYVSCPDQAHVQATDLQGVGIYPRTPTVDSHEICAP